MKKIALITNVFEEVNFGSGGEKVFYQFVKKFIDEGNIVDLYCTKHKTPKELRHLKINELIEIGHPKDYKRAKKIERTVKKYKKIIEEKNYDEVWAENFVPYFPNLFIQGHSALRFLQIQPSIFSKIKYFLMRFDHILAQKRWIKDNKIQKIIVPSYFLRNEIAENFKINKEKFDILRPGLTSVEKIEKDFSKLVLGLSAPSFTKKGGYIFLCALAHLKRTKLDFKAKIIYPKWKTNLMLRFFVHLWDLKDCVEFLPAQKNMEEFYNSINVIVVPSLIESFAMLATEGMNYSNIPVISNVAGASELIQDGKNGFVFNIQGNSAKNLAVKILDLAICDKQKISREAKNTADTLDWSKW